MTSFITAVPMPTRRSAAAAVLVAASLGIAAFTAMSSGTASAATGSCDPGDFCMWWGPNEIGGLYENAGSDKTLDDDYFENIVTDEIVGDDTSSVWNRGFTIPMVSSMSWPSRASGIGASGCAFAKGRAATCLTAGREKSPPTSGSRAARATDTRNCTDGRRQRCCWPREAHGGCIHLERAPHGIRSHASHTSGGM
jgi:peptidase inhibitor family I36